MQEVYDKTCQVCGRHHLVRIYYIPEELNMYSKRKQRNESNWRRLTTLTRLTEDGVDIGDTRSPVLPEVTPRVV